MLDLEQEATILANNMMGGRSEEFVSGIIRTLETIEQLAKDSTNDCLMTTDIQEFMDRIYQLTEGYY